MSILSTALHSLSFSFHTFSKKLWLWWVACGVSYFELTIALRAHKTLATAGQLIIEQNFLKFPRFRISFFYSSIFWWRSAIKFVNSVMFTIYNFLFQNVSICAIPVTPLLNYSVIEFLIAHVLIGFILFPCYWIVCIYGTYNLSNDISINFNL